MQPALYDNIVLEIEKIVECWLIHTYIHTTD